MVCAARAKQSSCSRPSPFPLLLLPANAMLQSLWSSGVSLSAVVPATRENVERELPWIVERETPREIERVADLELSVWIVFFVCGVFAVVAISAIAGL